MAPLMIWGGLLFLGTTGVASWVGHFLVQKIAEVREASPDLQLAVVVRAYAAVEPTLEWIIPIAFPVVSLLFLIRREMPFRAMMIYVGTAFTLCTIWCSWTLISALVMHGVVAKLAAAGS